MTVHEDDIPNLAPQDSAQLRSEADLRAWFVTAPEDLRALSTTFPISQCYRLKPRSPLDPPLPMHVKIVGYDDPQTVTVVASADSMTPGVVMTTNPHTRLLPCGCGRYKWPRRMGQDNLDDVLRSAHSKLVREHAKLRRLNPNIDALSVHLVPGEQVKSYAAHTDDGLPPEFRARIGAMYGKPEAFIRWQSQQPAIVRALAETYPCYACYRRNESLSDAECEPESAAAVPAGSHVVILSYRDDGSLAVGHGKDSKRAGAAYSAVDPTLLSMCDCGQWQAPTPGQLARERFKHILAERLQGKS